MTATPQNAPRHIRPPSYDVQVREHVLAADCWCRPITTPDGARTYHRSVKTKETIR